MARVTVKKAMVKRGDTEPHAGESSVTRAIPRRNARETGASRDDEDASRGEGAVHGEHDGHATPVSMDDPTTWPGCTEREDAFARAYARTGDLREALLAAGCTIGQNEAPQAASRVARLSLKRPHLREAVSGYQRLLMTRFAVHREAVVAQLARMGFADVADLCDPDTGEFLPPHRLPARIRATIAGVSCSVSPDGTRRFEYKLTPRVKALELLARVTGMVDSKAAKPLRLRLVADPTSGRVAAEVELRGDIDKVSRD
jgi:hypothetical protein